MYERFNMKPERLRSLPGEIRRELREARHERGWSQLDLGHRVGLPQVHISNIETGKSVPRFDTLLDIVRVLGRDLILIPRALVPVVNALIHDYLHESGGEMAEIDDRPLYVADSDRNEEYGKEQTFDV